MPKITVLPHNTRCPDGAEIEAQPGDNLIRVLLAHAINIEHACEMQCACATCHVYIREGAESINPASEKEDDKLNTAWELDMDSRLSCQVTIGEKDLVVEIPKYHANLVSEK